MKDNRPPKNANLYIATDILKNFSQILSYAERPQKPITIDRGKSRMTPFKLEIILSINLHSHFIIIIIDYTKSPIIEPLLFDLYILYVYNTITREQCHNHPHNTHTYIFMY